MTAQTVPLPGDGPRPDAPCAGLETGWVGEAAHLARRMLARTGADPGPLRLVHLRRKPGRGAVVRLHSELTTPPRRAHREAPPLWLALDERALAGPLPGSLERLVAEAALSGDWPGTLTAADLGVSLQGFGVDARLPALGAACAPAPGGEVWTALEEAVRQCLGRPVDLLAVASTPVRYKPGSRCVIRYTLGLDAGVPVTVFGKLYADPLRAVTVDAIMRRLHAEQAASGEPPALPRPLGVAQGAGLALTAAGGGGDGAPGALLPGIRVLLPRRRGPGERHPVPTAALTAAAEGLARLHGSSVGLRDSIGVVRSGPREATRVRERAALLGVHAPALAPRIDAIAERLAARLAATACDAPVVGHGGFKPSQLVYGVAGGMVITDFDGLCLADPALDVGYFLAYLRPARIWQGRAETETRFVAAAQAFTEAYARGMVRGGTTPATVAATLGRAALFEAALLLKIACRRPQRLNSPRPAELAAMLDEVGACLATTSRAA
jgi:Phosphotransferase enzyme family